MSSKLPDKRIEQSILINVEELCNFSGLNDKIEKMEQKEKSQI